MGVSKCGFYMFEANKFLGLASYGFWKVEVRVILKKENL
jgi:hypothetical protein